MKNQEENTARLKHLMTAPPMSANRHAAILRKRIALRRMLEDARELARLAAGNPYQTLR